MNPKSLVFLLASAALSLSSLSNLALAEGETAPPSTPVTMSDSSGDGEDLKMFRFAMRMDKLEFIKKTMRLNEEQETKFLEQYDHYDIELKSLNDERLATIKDYAANFEKITDKEADKLVKRSLEFRKKRTALLEKYYGKIAKATSKITAARFLQVESVLQGAGDVTIGASIPLMEK